MVVLTQKYILMILQQLNDFRKHNEIKVKVKEGQKLYGVKIPS